MPERKTALKHGERIQVDLRHRSVPAERAFGLYESFRPAIPAGVKGWGAAGVLDLDRLKTLASDG